ncbi:hypothetical protein BST61_g7573 [Cercospora zeina]
MQLLSILFVVPFALGYTTSPTATEPCLSEPEAANIARRWFSIFQTDAQGNGTGAALVDVTLAPNFQYTDEGATFGDPAPLYTNQTAVYDSVSSSGYSDALVTDVKYDVLYVFSGCSVIGAR